MGTNHLRTAFQRALILAQLAEDKRSLGMLIRTGWTGIAETTTLCVDCGTSIVEGTAWEKAHYVRRPGWTRFIHASCPPVQDTIDDLRQGQHEDLVMHNFLSRGGGSCERCSKRFEKYQVVYEVRPYGSLPLDGKIYERCCKECVSVFK